MTWPHYSNRIANLVKKTILSGKVNYWTGNLCEKFENKFSKFIDVKYCCSISNASVGLEIALNALDIKKNDEVIVPSRTYITSASAILRVNAKPIFADIEKNSLNIDINSIKKNINRNTKAIICVHLAGYPCDMENILKIAKKNNLKVIEDCSQAHGAMIKNRSVGSFGDISVWSFCNDKIISTGGEGGMIACNNKTIYKKIWSIKDCGRSYDKIRKKTTKVGYRWLYDSIGTNFRMTEMQAAIGILQLKELKSYLKKRNRNANILRNALKKINFIDFQNVDKKLYHAYYRFTILVNKTKIKKGNSRDTILKQLINNKIPATVGVCPELYKEKVFHKFRKKYTDKYYAKEVGKNIICFSVDPSISEKNMQSISNKIKRIMKNCENL